MYMKFTMYVFTWVFMVYIQLEAVDSKGMQLQKPDTLDRNT